MTDRAEGCKGSELGASQIFGLTFIIEAGAASILCVLILFALVLRNAISQKKHPFQTHLDIYLMSLFVADIFQGLVAVLDIRWAQTGRVDCGTHCVVQGLMCQFGQTAVAMSTLAITIHTFFVILFRWKPPTSKRIPLCVVGVIWAYNILFAAIGYGTHTGKGGTQVFYVPSPYGCWLYPSAGLRLLSQYFWLNLALFSTTVLYIPLFFAIRGDTYLIVGYTKRWYRYRIILSKPESGFSPTPAVNWEEDPGVAADIQSAAKKMLWYPVAYAITALPADVIRWAVLQKIDPAVPVKDIPFTAIAVFWSMFNISGVVNVILFTLTRPRILLFGSQRESGEQRGNRSTLDGDSMELGRKRAYAQDGGYGRRGEGSGGSVDSIIDVVRSAPQAPPIAKLPAGHQAINDRTW
ncbi:hypothetical protein BOTBODRAFT_149018 [Botryobasidium botryosum FD-172 SS1]|uniref:G-protein coupled receptors family 1 profile domain-containing protein n=1 Tax=Botryobasidium botryosum (strain FD-172 SS1) TaxID=930990 RepID=A0A067M7M7_BOTB1|nr:hypothetical protein BOTBODRAFT_149018 [Botryobasidium botryosum FD-172 SS1]